jgi:hypothetical protein
MEIIIDITMTNLEALMSFVCPPLAFVLGKIVLKRMEYKWRKSL